MIIESRYDERASGNGIIDSPKMWCILLHMCNTVPSMGKRRLLSHYTILSGLTNLVELEKNK